MTPDPIPNPANPDRGEEDYLSVIASQLLAVRHRYHHALAQQEQMLHQANSHVQAAHDAQQAVWEEHEDYLIEALRWHEKKSGSSRLECEVGVFYLDEEPARVIIRDAEQVRRWAHRMTGDLVFLGAALPGAAAPDAAAPTTTAPKATEAKVLTEAKALINAEVLVAEFYRRTGLLPDGCRLILPRPVPALE